MHVCDDVSYYSVHISEFSVYYTTNDTPTVIESTYTIYIYNIYDYIGLAP